MALQDRFDLEDLVNESERLVFDALETELADAIDRVSEEEILDIAALALNHVRPRYRVNLLGRLYAQNVSDEERTEVDQAVRSAILKVRPDVKR
ncbi:MAG: competence protein ComFB [Spirochaetaceae bacterium]|nr:MAG: competence protein ComFB [Spirochaetaceae bacterium]